MLIVERNIIYKIFKNKKKNEFKIDKKNIVIFGGISTNKGCQAMTFTVIDEIKQHFPNKNIYLIINPDFDRKIEEIENYNFEILLMNNRIRCRVSSPCYRFLTGNPRYSFLEKKIISVIRNSEFMIDVYGFRLSSQLIPDTTWISCILEIIIAKKNSIPYFLFPQSIGPFNFKLLHRLFFYTLAKIYLKYPRKVFVRENDGVRYLKQFRKTNIKKTYDIVLQKKPYNIFNLFKKKVNFRNLTILKNSVGLIPNIKIIKKSKLNDIYPIYYILIKKLIACNKTVYILKHSLEDFEICEHLKDFFKNNKNVVLISDDLNVFEIEDIVKEFDFMIASRYHSIIHAYKNNIPVLAIGWARKYYELLKTFNQLDYYFDINENIVKKNIVGKLEKMILNYKNEKTKISLTINNLSNNKIWPDLVKSIGYDLKNEIF